MALSKAKGVSKGASEASAGPFARIDTSGVGAVLEDHPHVVYEAPAARCLVRAPAVCGSCPVVVQSPSSFVGPRPSIRCSTPFRSYSGRGAERRSGFMRWLPGARPDLGGDLVTLLLKGNRTVPWWHACFNTACSPLSTGPKRAVSRPKE